MKKIDLHLHSYYSDGSSSLEEILSQIEREKVSVFSITDHNFISPEIENFQKTIQEAEMGFLQGVEISCMDKTSRQSIHMLGYSKSFNIEKINNDLKTVLVGYNERAKKIVEKLNQEFGFDLNFEKIKSSIKSPFVSRNLLAEILIEKVDKSLTMKDALKKVFINEDDSWMIDAEEAIDIIKRSGGKAILAHPGNLINKLNFDNLVINLKDRGLDGVETYYRKHDLETVEFLKNKCKELNLVITGGSDWHGHKYSDFSPGILIEENTYNQFINLFKA